jgi:phosphate transport system substrate-binding protein
LSANSWILEEERMKKPLSYMALILFLLFGLASTTRAEQQELIGAGATFPYPLYSKMFDIYSKEYGVKVNYQAIGSGGGIRQLINKTVDFGGSDAVM